MKDIPEKMIYRITFLMAIFFTSCATSQDDNLRPTQTEETPPLVKKDTTRLTFETVKELYDTLIPIFDGLMITYSRLDTVALGSHNNTLYNSNTNKSADDRLNSTLSFGIYHLPDELKWGVIDSAGNIVVPFICDGIAKVSEHEGIFSIGTHHHHLDTGVPRYHYEGQSFRFDKTGKLPITPEKFSYNIIFGRNYYEKTHVIQQGTSFYLPFKFVKLAKTSMGSHEGQ